MVGTPRKKMSHAKRLLEKGEYQKTLSLADELLESYRDTEDSLYIVDVLIIKAEAAWRSGQLEDGFNAVAEGEARLKAIEKGQAKGQETEIRQRRGDLLHHGGILYWYKGDLDAALKYHKQDQAIKEKLGDRKGIASSFNNLGLVYWSKGDLDHTLENYRQALAINEELGDKRDIAVTVGNLGNVYARLGNLDQALEYQKRSLAIQEELGNKPGMFKSLINLGAVYQFKGDLTQALEYYQQSLVLSEESGIKRDIALAMNNLGNIYQLKGELDEALQYFQKSLEIYQELGIKEDTALVFANIGEIYRIKGNSREAQKYYQKSLKIYAAMGNTPLIAVVLSELVWIGLEREDSPLVEQSLRKLKQISEQTGNRIINQRYRIATALVLKASKRARDKVKAGEILEQVADEEVGDHSLTVTAMIHLCDLLLSELKMTGEDELFGEIKNLTEQLLEIAERQASHSLLAETYLLQSKLALIELDMGQAKKLLLTAHTIAQEKGLDKLSKTLEDEQNQLQSQMERWNLLIKENPSKQELIGLTKLDDLLGTMIQKTVADLMEERGISDTTIKTKYKLVYLDLLKDAPKIVKNQFRVGIAQIGLSQTGDILHEFYKEKAPGLFGIRKDKVTTIQTALKNMVEQANSKKINILILPELTIDLNYPVLYDDVLTLAKTYNMYIIPGSYHDPKTKHNLSIVVSPEGILWKQEKHIPANINFEGKRITEGIDTKATPRTIIIGNTEYGRIAIVLCRDFLDMDLRVELKNFEPPIDLLINPAFTPVTADFKAAHFDARRSIYAYCFFANVAEFGDSLIYTPEKERTERTIPPKEEDLIYKDIDLFRLRSERKKWELEQKKQRPFIQSTR